MVRARILAAATLAAGFAFAFTPAQAAVLIDGNFNDPLVSGTYTELSGGAQFGGPSSNAWTVLGDSVDVIGNYWQAPTAGGGSVDLAGSAAGGIEQSFTLAPGTYQLSFYLGGNPDGAPTVKTVQVSVGGVTQDFTFDVTGKTRTGMGFELETLDFISAGGANTLSFLDQNTGPFGPVVGGISIAGVPEAATWMMLILGFGGIGMMLRGQRRQATLAV